MTELQATSPTSHDQKQQSVRLHIPIWGTPAVLFVLSNALSLSACSILPADTIARVTGGLWVPDTSYLKSLWLVLSAGALGSAIGLSSSARHFHRQNVNSGWAAVTNHQWLAGARLLARIALGVNLLYFLLAVVRGLHPAVMLSVLEGDSSALSASRAALQPVAGLTTIVAVGGPAAGVLLASERKSSRANSILVLALVGCGIFRMIMNAERLALFETVIPVAMALGLRNAARPARRLGFLVLGFVGVGVLIFVLGELIRPSYASVSGSESLETYVGDRLLGYYVSSTANGQYLASIIPSVPSPNYTADFIWNAPGVNHLVTPAQLFGFDSRTAFREYLYQRLNPSLNTVSTLGSIDAEWGPIGGCAVTATIGLVLGFAHKYLDLACPASISLYAILFLGTSESLRYPYFFESRFLLALFALFIIPPLARFRLRRESL